MGARFPIRSSNDGIAGSVLNPQSYLTRLEPTILCPIVAARVPFRRPGRANADHGMASTPPCGDLDYFESVSDVEILHSSGHVRLESYFVYSWPIVMLMVTCFHIFRKSYLGAKRRARNNENLKSVVCAPVMAPPECPREKILTIRLSPFFVRDVPCSTP